MRIAQKKQAANRIRLLGKIHEEIRQQMEKQETECVVVLLEQCQQWAGEMGNIIESEEGENHASVKLLEAYCEFVYQIYKEITVAQSKEDAVRVYKKLHEWQIRIAECIEKEIQIRREAVFLPYKASMWDSLESIWKAADEDPDCDAYVIPIPYYDRRQDGSIGKMHYEGNLYPAYVSVTDYKDYDFEARRPDLIFIHNPYDENNYVTSVHPFFYAKNLKQFTERLVYVPYFVLDEIAPDDETAVEEVSCFCTVSGVLYADRVIVQSESMRQIYIDVMVKFVHDNRLGRAYWEEKILGLGSPKTDRIITLKRKDLEIPEEWEKLIQKPDGSCKKVIFYNTTIHTFLQYEEKMLDKMNAVFDFFRQRKEEAVLFWRPHPLLDTAIESSCPRLLSAYREMVRQFRIGKWGIYDDTSELDRAIALCDAYYGDRSSVVQLCRMAGRIVLLQDMEHDVFCAEDKLDNPVSFKSVYDDGCCFWFAGYDYNALFQMDKRSYKINLVNVFPDESFMQEMLYSSVAMCDEKLYFAPYAAERIAIYDLKMEKFKMISLETYDMNEKFFHAISADGKVYFIPYRYPGILCYEKEADTLTCHDDWVDQIEKIRSSDWGYFIDCEVVDKKLVLPCACADAVVIFDTETGKAEVIQTEATGFPCKYCGICHTDDVFYLISADGTVAKRKLRSEAEEVRKINLQADTSTDAAYYPVTLADESICFFPFQERTGFKMDTRTDEVVQVKILEEERAQKKGSFSFLMSVYDGETLYAVAENSRCLLEYDLHHENRKEIRLFLSEKDRTYLKECRKKDFCRRVRENCITENETDSLKLLLEALPVYREADQDQNEAEAGNRIYHTLI